MLLRLLLAGLTTTGRQLIVGSVASGARIVTPKIGAATRTDARVLDMTKNIFVRVMTCAIWPNVPVSVHLSEL